MKNQEIPFLDRLRESRQTVAEAIGKLEALPIDHRIRREAIDRLEYLLFYIEDQIRNVKDEERREND